MADAQHTSTRRTVLAALAGTAAISAAPAAALANTGVSDRATWDQLERRWREAKAAYEAAYEAVGRAYAAVKREAPSLDTIHWRCFQLRRDQDYVARRMDLEKDWAFYQAGEGKWWWSPDPEQSKREYRAALDSIAAFRKAEREVEDRHRLSQLEDELDTRVKEFMQAEKRLLEEPAPNGAALQLKLEILYGPDQLEDGQLPSWSLEHADPFFADVRRLASALDRA